MLGTIRSRTHHYPFRLIPPRRAPARTWSSSARPRGSRSSRRCSRWWSGPAAAASGTRLSVLDQLIAGAGPEGVTYARAVALLGVTDAALIDEMCDALAAGDGAARVRHRRPGRRGRARPAAVRRRPAGAAARPDRAAAGAGRGREGPDRRARPTSSSGWPAQAPQLGPATLSRCADIVHNGLVEMRGTTAPRLLLELIMRPDAAARAPTTPPARCCSAWSGWSGRQPVAASRRLSRAPRRRRPPPRRRPGRSRLLHRLLHRLLRQRRLPRLPRHRRPGQRRPRHPHRRHRRHRHGPTPRPLPRRRGPRPPHRRSGHGRPRHRRRRVRRRPLARPRAGRRT